MSKYIIIPVEEIEKAMNAGPDAKIAYTFKLIKNAKQISLDEKDIEEKAREFYWKRNPDKIIAENTRPNIVIGYVQAILDIKKELL